MRLIAVAVLAGCGAAARPAGSVATLRPACGDGEIWTGTACASTRPAAQQLAVARQAIFDQQVDQAKAALDAAAHAGPLDHASDVALWEQRGIAAAYLDDPKTATTAFDMLLALDPGHVLSYKLSPKATLVFEDLRGQQGRVAPELDITWARGGKVGDPVPLDVEVVADPKAFLHRATVFVREHGETRWRAADLTLSGKGERRLVLPPIAANKPVSLEVYAKAYDDRGNEVLVWADPARPREIPLRYEPPAPWYRTWWGLGAIGTVVAAAAAVTVYELTLAPPDKITGSASLGH